MLGDEEGGYESEGGEDTFEDGECVGAQRASSIHDAVEVMDDEKTDFLRVIVHESDDDEESEGKHKASVFGSSTKPTKNLSYLMEGAKRLKGQPWNHKKSKSQQKKIQRRVVKEQRRKERLELFEDEFREQLQQKRFYTFDELDKAQVGTLSKTAVLQRIRHLIAPLTIDPARIKGPVAFYILGIDCVIDTKEYAWINKKKSRKTNVSADADEDSRGSKQWKRKREDEGREGEEGASRFGGGEFEEEEEAVERPPEYRETVIQLTGICTIPGESDVRAAVYIHGFRPYGYVSATQKQMEMLERKERTMEQLAAYMQRNIPHAKSVTPCSPDHKCYMKFGLPSKKEYFFKIEVDEPGHISKIRDLVEKEPFDWVGPGPLQDPDAHNASAVKEVLRTFEMNIPFVARFSADMGCSGGSFVTLKDFEQVPRDKRTSCFPLEVRMDIANVHVGERSEYPKIPPKLRILSFDIECATDAKRFPDHKLDGVLMICCTLATQHYMVNKVTEDAKTKEKTVTAVMPETTSISFALRSYHDKDDNKTGNVVFTFGEQDSHTLDDERAMLNHFFFVLRHLTPDIVTGYNTLGFDWKYLIYRAIVLGRVPTYCTPLLVHTTCKMTLKGTKGQGEREIAEMRTPGFLVQDAYNETKRLQRLGDYTLNSVAFKLLKQRKADVHHSFIWRYFVTNVDQRTILLHYCQKDAYLALHILFHQHAVLELIENLQLCKLGGGIFLTAGAELRSQIPLLCRAKQLKFLIPTVTEPRPEMDMGDNQYEGATCLPTIRGIHKFVIVLDFSSLYPSLIISLNLCHTTLIDPADVKHVHPDDRHFVAFDEDGNGAWFLKKHVRKSVLAAQLEIWLAARTKTKQEAEAAAEAGDHDLAKVLDIRQNSIKLWCNSAYGICAATRMRALAIAQSITASGRRELQNTITLVHQRYPHLVVVAGDTDSVMLRERDDSTLERCHEIGADISKWCHDKRYKDFWPMKLAYEKTMHPHCLFVKKRYCGMKFEPHKEGEKPKKGKQLIKGIECVRRDALPFTTATLTWIVEKMIDNYKDVDRVIRYVRKQSQRLRSGQDIDMREMVLSRNRSKHSLLTTSLPPHEVVAAKMDQRSAGSAPSVGNRCFFVFSNTTGKVKTTAELAEDPMYVLQHSLPLAWDHYHDNHFVNPVTRIASLMLEPFIKQEWKRQNKEVHLSKDDQKMPKDYIEARVHQILFGNKEFFFGTSQPGPEETKTDVKIHIASKWSGLLTTGSIRADGMHRFADKQVTRCYAKRCIRASVTGKLLCEEHKGLTGELYRDMMALAEPWHTEFDKNAKTCHDCSGTFAAGCANRDCVLFYRRVKVTKEHERYNALLPRCTW